MTPALPTEPVFEHQILPGRSSIRQSLAGMWQYRDLLPTLARRELSTRYARTRMRTAWLLARPLVNVAVYFIVFVLVLRLDHGGMPYPLLLISGLVAWSPFTETLGSAGKALQLDADLLRRTVMPRVAFPLYRTLLAGPEILLLSALLLAACGWYGYSEAFSWRLLLLPLAVALHLLLIFGLALLTNVLLVFRQDWHHLFFVLFGYLLWATPVFYSVDKVPAALRVLVALNPLAAVVSLYRYTLLGLPPALYEWLPGTGLTGLILWAGLRYYTRLQDLFSERI